MCAIAAVLLGLSEISVCARGMGYVTFLFHFRFSTRPEYAEMIGVAWCRTSCAKKNASSVSDDDDTDVELMIVTKYDNVKGRIIIEKGNENNSLYSTC